MIGERLQVVELLGRPVVALLEQMREPPLQFEIIGDGPGLADRHNVGERAALQLHQREQPAFDRAPRDFDGQRRIVAPAERTGRVDDQEGRPFHPHRVAHFPLEISRVGYRS